MNESSKIESNTEQPFEHQQVNIEKSLYEQRLDICLRLQMNRRVLEHKLLGNNEENHFPRSATMRFLSRQSTHQIIHKAANAALGLQTIKTFRNGLKAAKFIRSFFKHEKKSSEITV